MEGNTVTAATGSLGPVIAKLARLLGKEYQLLRQTRSDIALITSKLSSIYSLLFKRWGREAEEASEGLKISIGLSPSPLIEPQIRARTDLKMEALELADDVENAVDEFVMKMTKNSTGEAHTRLGSSRGREVKKAKTVKRIFKQTNIQPLPFQDLMERVRDVSKRCRSKWKRKNGLTICSLFPPEDAFSSSSKPLCVDRRAPFLSKDSSQLVGMDGPMDELAKFLVEKEGSNLHPQIKMVSMVGSAGVGKTVLANLLYTAIGDKFDSRAIVSVTPHPNMKEILTSILKQVTADSAPFSGTEGTANEKNLIVKISNFLKDKRYVVIVDDIWQLEAWETIKKALPENSTGSRIIMTTRNNDVAEKCSDGSDALVYKINFLGAAASREMVIKADIVGEGFKHTHPVVRICGGMPLALGCMMAAVAKEQNQQGPGVKTSDVQDKIVKEVVQHGIKNILEFQPLEASLQVGYEDLPHLTLKSCLLYCSIYPENWRISRNHLVRKWMYEGFVDEEKAANNYFDDLVNRGWIQMRKEEEEEEDQDKEEDEEEQEEEQEKYECEEEEDDVEEEEEDHESDADSDLEPVGGNYYIIHPMMRNFLQWKSREENFITYISDNISSYASGISRMSLDHRTNPGAEKQVDLSGVNLSKIRSLTVFGDAKRVPFKLFKGLRVLDLQYSTGLQNDDLKDICGALCVRHLLGLRGKGITEIPPEIVALQRLETLDMSRSGIRKLAEEMKEMQHLKTLNVSNTMVTELQGEIIKELMNLETLDVSHTGLTELPEELMELLNLETLDLSHTGLIELPEELMELRHLKILDVSNTEIRKLPREIMECLLNLERLCVRNTALTELPKTIRKLQRLKTLDVSNTMITKLQGDMIKELLNLETLDVSCTQLTELPKEIENLEYLVSLDVSHTGLTKLPSEIGKLKRLKCLDVSETLLSELPKQIGSLEELETLNLSATPNMTKLPREIGNLKRLKTLHLHKELRLLPWEVGQLSKSLRVSNYGKVVILPECVCQAWKNPKLLSELEEQGVILYVDMINQFFVVEEQVFEAALVVSSQNMDIPKWVNLHFRDLTYLDIRVCDLDEKGLNILREMPYLHTLVIKVEVVPREPIAITSGGFKKLQVLVVESRSPRVTFKEGAMPKLRHIMLQFRSYAGPTNDYSPLGITHLRSLKMVVIWCNDWYTEHSPCIAWTIHVVKKEAREHRNSITVQVRHWTNTYPGNKNAAGGSDIQQP